MKNLKLYKKILPRTKLGKGCLISFIVVLLFVIIGILGSDDNQPEAVPTPPVTDQAAVEPVPVKPVTLTDKLWQAVDTSIKDREGVEISVNEAEKEVMLSYTSDSFWDETAAVKTAVSMFVKYGLVVMPMEEISILEIRVKTEFTDTFGKKEIKDAVRITMAESEFNKFDWPNLEYMPVMNQFEISSSEFYIHPAILKNLKRDKVTLSL